MQGNEGLERNFPLDTFKIFRTPSKGEKEILKLICFPKKIMKKERKFGFQKKI